MDSLPAELILHIASCKYTAALGATSLNGSIVLEAQDIVRLHLVSKRLLKITRDNELWREQCFDNSYSEAARRIHDFQPAALYLGPDRQVPEIQRRAATLPSTGNGHIPAVEVREEKAAAPESSATSQELERTRALANWVPSYNGENVDWYGEYIARHASISMSWLQQPKITDHDLGDIQEIRGMGLHHDSNGSRVVAPLDDGSVCLWEIGYKPEDDNSDRFRRGAIIARSKPGLLSVSGTNEDSEQNFQTYKTRLTSTGVVECVSVDNVRNKAYFAAQRGLNEVDLNTLQVSRHEKYPFSISALSEVTYPTPLTVGTTLSLHLHDPRRSSNACWSDANCEDRVDTVAKFPAAPHVKNDFYRLLAGDVPSEYAPLFKAGPLSIHHLFPPGHNTAGSGQIYVAGRFPSLLVYDRRKFPKLQRTMHSGARLCSLTSLPYCFETREDNYNRRSQSSVEDPQEPRILSGSTLVACGEYNGKGSLEMYGLPSETSSSPTHICQQTTFKNRVNASRTKLLSIARHGTRLVVSDGDGQLRWIERDGTSLVRRWNINQYQPAELSGIFNRSVVEAGSGDVARKLLSTNAHASGHHIDRDELLLWTGEKIGVLAFKSKPQFGMKEWEERVESAEEEAKRHEERMYRHTMRRALERQADEVRFVKGLGTRFRMR